MKKEPKYQTGNVGVENNPKAGQSTQKQQHTIQSPKASTQHY